MTRKKKEINVIWMVSKEEFNRRFTLAAREYFKTHILEDFKQNEQVVQEFEREA